MYGHWPLKMWKQYAKYCCFFPHSHCNRIMHMQSNLPMAFQFELRLRNFITKKHNHKARANARTLIDTDGWLRPYLPWLKIAESSIIFDFIYLLDSIRFNIQWLTYFIFTWIGRSVGKFLPFRICLIKCPCALCRRLPLLVKPGPIYLYHPNRTHYAIKIRSK